MSENKLLRDLTNGVNPEKNLPKFAQSLFDSYYKISFAKLAVNLTTYYDDLEMASGLDGEKIRSWFVRILEMIQSKGDDQDRSELASIRKEITVRMESLYEYVHVLGIYEHVCNRIQNAFDESVAETDLEVLLAEIRAYIQRDPEPTGMNERIQNVFGELPVRITKSLFLDIVSKGCGYYKGTRSDISEYFFNDMYKQAQLRKAQDLNKDYADLNEITSDVEKIDFKNVSAETLKKTMDKLEIAGQQLSGALSYYFQLIELINDLYIILLSKEKADKSNSTVATSAKLMLAYIKAAQDKDFIGMNENILEDINKLNGDLENMTGLHMLFEDRLLVVDSKYVVEIEALGLKTDYEALRKCNLLSGFNILGDVDDLKPVFVTDQAYIDGKTAHLLDLYRQMFTEHPILIRRAVISDALSKLPIPFDSVDESMNFIRQNLESCKSAAEVSMSAMLIREIMNNTKW